MSGKLALFIDGQTLYFTAKALGLEIDFKRLLADFDRSGALLRAYYYAQVQQDGESSGQRPFLDWLTYNGYTVKETTHRLTDNEGRRKFKRNQGIALAVDALELADLIDRMFLFSGDGDFCRLVVAMQRRGVHVTVVSTVAVRPPMIADELRRCADDFLDLAGLKETISRPTTEAWS